MENIKSYLDGELDIAQQAEVETHLRNDAELQKMVEEFRSISSTLKTSDTGEPYGADTLEEKLIAARSAQAGDNKKIWRMATMWSGSAACIALAAAMLFPVFAQSKVSANKSSQLAAKSLEKSSLSFGSTRDQSEIPPNLRTGSAEESAKFQAEVQAGAMKGAGGFSEGDGVGGGGAADAPRPASTPGSADMSSSTLDTSVSSETQASDRTKATFQGSAGKTLSPRMSYGSARGRTEGVDKMNGAVVPMEKPQEPESKFKSDMRAIRDKSAKASTELSDTPHGIYLERSGQIEIKVEDLIRSVDEVTGMVQGLNGFVSNHELHNEADGGTATMIVRVPTKNYTAAMNKLQSMGEVIAVNSASEDITTPMVENSTRMISWADEEKRLMDELAKAKTENQKYYIRQQLSQARVNLAAHKAQVESLKQRSDFSTINVNFFRGDKADKVVGGSSNWSGNAFKEAKSGLGSIGQILGVICIYAAVFSPIWLPFVIAALIIRKRNQS